jgi:ABC-type Fe3+/spermidine/putrescine transport system ATPase subunit
MIEAQHLTKRYRNTTAVDEVSFVVQPGRVTGFLGPNGAGKSTTMRMVLGLDTPSSGSVLVNGKPYAQLADPLRSVGALLDAKAIVGSRSAANHLKWLADSNGIDRRRVGEVLDIVGLADVAGKRVSTFSLGMNQRLGIAAALLGDPETVMFDEPINGLDPQPDPRYPCRLRARLERQLHAINCTPIVLICTRGGVQQSPRQVLFPSRHNEPGLVSHDDCLGAVAQPKLVQQPTDVGLDSLLGDHEALRDLDI